MPEIIYKEVYFHEYCKTCKFRDTPEHEDPCNDCLEHPANLYFDKPVDWKKRDD